MKAVQYSDYVWNASLKMMPTLQTQIVVSANYLVTTVA